MTHFCALTSSRSQSGNKADSFAVPTSIAIQRCKLETFKRLCDLKFAMTATCLQWKQCSAWPGKNVTNWWFFIFDNLLLAKLFPARRKSAVSWHVFKKKNLNLWNNRKILLRFVYIRRWYLLSWTLVLAQLPNKPLVWLFRKADTFRVTWSENVCVCEVVSDLSLKGIDREGLEKGRADTRQILCK